jgi:hypothetical protein
MMRSTVVCTLPDIIRVIKSRRTGRAGHVARMEEVTNTCKTLVGKPKGKKHSEDLGVDGRILLKWTLEK